jgi:hypothetical protein
VELQGCILEEGPGMADSNCKQEDTEHLQTDRVRFFPVTHLSSMKAFITIVRYYMAFVILLVETFKPQRTKDEQTKQIHMYEHEEDLSEVLELSASLDYVCKSVRKNCGSCACWSP